MRTKNIDLSLVGVRDALDMAVLVEEEAKERYLEFADQMQVHRNPDAERFFRFMAENEEKHRAALASRRHERFGDEPRIVSRAMIFDVEAPDYGAVRVFMTVREALGAAMEAEQKAHGFFVQALEQAQDAEARALFTELRDEELLHQRLVGEQLAKLPPDDPGDIEDYADGPVTVD